MIFQKENLQKVVMFLSKTTFLVLLFQWKTLHKKEKDWLLTLYYELNNFGNVFSFSDGYVNNPYFKWNISRNSIDQPLYPRSGSSVSLTFKTSVYPYSRVNGFTDHGSLTDQEKYKFLQYNKLKFTTSWFTPISRDKKLVVNARLGFGLLNGYNKNIGVKIDKNMNLLVFKLNNNL